MRERVLNAIYKKIDEEPENKNLQKQITLLNKSSICTIDSFCLEIVKNYFYELENISPNFRIADTTEIELMKQETVEELFEQKYEEQNKEFLELINIYTSYRDDTPLKELILKIYTYIQSNPFPQKWLKDKIEMFNQNESTNKDFSETIWGNILLKEIEEELIDDISTLKGIQKELEMDFQLEKFQQVIRSDIDMLETLKNNLNNWDKAYQISQNLNFITWPRQKIESELKDLAKDIRTEVKTKLNKKIDKILIYDSKEAFKDINDMYKVLLKLKEIILEFETAFSKRKREKNIVDFNDIEHFALNILLNESLEPTEVAKKYQEKFEEIAIDEYQDSNLVQEYILTSISRKNNIFMVGDVKQSIYKFRQAMPELFLSKYESYEKNCKINTSPIAIQLFKNFRSRKNILDFTNLIFEDIMSKDLGDIDYDQNEFLNLGANYENISQDFRTEFDIINLTNEENDESKALNELTYNEDVEEKIEDERVEDIELEARFVANRIKDLIEHKFQVFDVKKNEFRDIKYKDIVILLRSTKQTAPIYEQELINNDIPVFSDMSQEYLDSIEIQTIMNLLKIIDNPMQDIPLVAILKSSIGNFTDNELVQIRLSDKYDNFYICMQKAKIDVDKKLKNKIEKFLNNLEKWRKEQEYLALDELIWKIYSDTGYYNYVGLMPNGALRQANLKMLFERAKQYETASFKGLYNFINFIEKLRLGSGDLGSAKLIGENDDVVRIMSIHKSKGLEFPVVFLSSTGKQFNLMDLNKNILLHQDMGIGVKYIDYYKQVQYDTLSKVAIRNKILTENLSEEMRILYVALTRAKEKLIITGISKDYEKEFEKMRIQTKQYKREKDGKINPILLKKYKKYLDWIMLVYIYEKENVEELIKLNVYNKKELLKKFKKVEENEVDVLKILNEKSIENLGNRVQPQKAEENDNEQKNIKIDKSTEIEKIKNIIESKYEHKIDTTIPTKTSVTKIKQMQDEKFEKQNESITFSKPKFLQKEEEEKLSGAQKGTLIHLCMQKLDVKVDYTIEKVKELIQQLEERQIITKNEAQNINPFKILDFTKSKIWIDMKEAKVLQKEKPFYINIPAKDLFEEYTEEMILVQGIIDLYYINKDDELVLVDYKTDYVENENELIAKYRKQLELYKQALEKSLKRKVSREYIYSTYLGKELSL